MSDGGIAIVTLAVIYTLGALWIIYVPGDGDI